MSGLDAESFSIYGTDEANMLAGMGWIAVETSGANGGLQNDPDGVSSGKVLQIAGQGLAGASTRYSIPAPGDIHSVGFRLWLPSLPVSDGVSFGVALKDASNNHKYLLTTNPSGHLLLYRTNGCGEDISSANIGSGLVVLVESTGAKVLSAGVWTHIEWRMNRTTGAYEIRVEGVNRLSGTDGSAATGDSAIIEFLAGWNASAGASTYPSIKDFTILDDAGSQNNTFVGPCTVYTEMVNADVSSGWSRSSGSTDYSLLNETTPNDAGYIQADDSPPAASIMGLANLPADVVAVRFIKTFARAWKTDGGDATLQVGLISNGDVDLGADNPVTVSPQYYWDISELDPDSAALWTPSGFNAATLQIDRTT